MIELTQGEEVQVPQACEYPTLNHQHGVFYFRSVLRFVRACGNDGSRMVLSPLFIRGV